MSITTNVQKKYPIFIIGNPHHHLGFMVFSTDDPLGYEDPAEAVFELNQLRKMYGFHLKLYQVFPINGVLVEKAELAKHAEDCEMDNLDYQAVCEYIK